VSDYDGLTRAELEQRLRYAEDVCVMFGWCGTDRSERGQAAEELWHRWAELVGPAYTGPAAHPELAGAEAVLAQQREQTRTTTLRRLLEPEEETGG
jgi:hypothetical protein